MFRLLADVKNSQYVTIPCFHLVSFPGTNRLDHSHKRDFHNSIALSYPITP